MAGELGHLLERHVDLDVPVLVFDFLHRMHEVGGKLVFAHQTDEGGVGIDVGQHDPGGDLLAVLEFYTHGLSLLDQQAFDRRPVLDLAAMVLERAHQRLREGPDPAFGGAEVIGVAHAVVIRQREARCRA